MAKKTKKSKKKKDSSASHGSAKAPSSKSRAKPAGRTSRKIPARRGTSALRKATRAVPGDGIAVNPAPNPAVDQASAGELIALRAFLKWQERGGDELSNWIDAEREVMSELEAAQKPTGRGRTAVRKVRRRAR